MAFSFPEDISHHSVLALEIYSFLFRVAPTVFKLSIIVVISYDYGVLSNIIYPSFEKSLQEQGGEMKYT